LAFYFHILFCNGANNKDKQNGSWEKLREETVFVRQA